MRVNICVNAPISEARSHVAVVEATCLPCWARRSRKVFGRLQKGELVKAAVYDPKRVKEGQLVEIVDTPRPELKDGHVLLRVLACGVCRTDLHITEGDLAALCPTIIPGHQIVGEVVDGGTLDLPLGTRVGFPGWGVWMGIAGTAETTWRTSATTLPSPDIQ